MEEKGEGGLMSFLGKAEKWLEDQGVTTEDLEKAKADSEAREAEQADARETDQREQRSAHVGNSRVTLSGMVKGSIDTGLSATTEEDGGQLFVTVESVDPVSLEGGTFTGFTFAIPGYHGPGTYDLGASEQPGLPYELWLQESQEGFFWTGEYGPGIVVVKADGKTMQVSFVFRDPGSNQVELEATVRLA
jgi:hypothetical protein